MEKNQPSSIEKYRALALRDIVVFPHSVVPLFVGREKSISTLQEASNKEEPILLLTQRKNEIEDPTQEDLFSVGTLGKIIQFIQLPDGSLKILVEGRKRILVERLAEEEGQEIDPELSMKFYGQPLVTIIQNEKEVEALRRLVFSKLNKYLKINKEVEISNIAYIKNQKDTEKFIDLLVPQLAMSIELKQEILEAISLEWRLELLLSYLGVEIEVAQVQKRICGRVKNDLERQQKEYVLQMQRKAIESELGDLEGSSGKNELNELEKKISSIPLSAEAKEKALSELKKLRYMNPMSSEATVSRNYIDLLLSLPWGKKSRLSKNLKKAEKILNDEHYGLEKVKEKILEFIAVQAYTGKTKGNVLCLVGPPGVGKTSLGTSIANATGRNFVRFSLGGVKDEAEIRGHRRTYIGAMPGKIIQEMKKAKTKNPLFLLDEVDKVGSDWRGDPASALLEVLDQRQNNAFNDHYLEVSYDLSSVMFVCTANTLNIPPALLDRMEVVRISGYTEDEKLEIAKRHLLPRLQEECGLKDENFHISDEAIRLLIRNYCKEAGVRNLEREILSLCRKTVKEILLKKTNQMKITKSNLKKYSGIARYERSESELIDMIGIATGLAWTEVGGEILSIEAVMIPGKGKITATGRLGEVMKESIQAASSFVRSKSTTYGIFPPLFNQRDIHVHVPEGAIPKDGPSAGVAICTAIVSLLTQIPVKGTVAMTGEISLRGKVLPIGGLKEKLLAARREGIETVIIPHDNIKDLEEIPKNVTQDLCIIPVKKVDEALRHALMTFPHPVEWEEELIFEKKTKELGFQPSA